jgi:ribonuclease T2
MIKQLRQLFAAVLCCLACVCAHADSAAPGQFDYYLLSLSWSPSYCLTHQQDRRQCGGMGLGFVLHGLWPQFDSGRYPQYCESRSDLPGQAAALGQTVYPSARLMQHEWESHGTCSGLDAMKYFKTADRALAVVQVPAMFEAPRHNMTLTRLQIAAAFHAANPTLPDDALTVICNREQLSEVRICLTRELTVRGCGRGVRSNCPDVALQVPSSR